MSAKEQVEENAGRTVNESDFLQYSPWWHDNTIFPFNLAQYALATNDVETEKPPVIHLNSSVNAYASFHLVRFI